MSLVTLPTELIILICEYIPYDCEEESHGPCVWTLLFSCKRFSFLADLLYLVHTSTEFGNYFGCLTIQGKLHGPEYITYEGRYLGYFEAVHGVPVWDKVYRTYMAGDECLYNMQGTIYCMVGNVRKVIKTAVQELYQHLHDRDVIEFITKGNGKVRLIGKSFPLLPIVHHEPVTSRLASNYYQKRYGRGF